jgi:hypothetical protein
MSKEEVIVMEKKVEQKKKLPLAPLISSSPTALRSPVGVKTYSRKRKVGGSSCLSSDSTTTSPSASPLPEGRSGRSKWLDILESLASEEDSAKPKQDEEQTKQEPCTTSDSPSSTNKKRKAVQMQLQFCSSSSSPLRSPSKMRSPRLAADSSPGGAKSRKRNRKETASSGARQMYLDLGQERFDWVTCGVCEMTYAPGVPTDEKTHNTFHQRFLKMQSSAASLGSIPSAI